MRISVIVGAVLTGIKYSVKRFMNYGTRNWQVFIRVQCLVFIYLFIYLIYITLPVNKLQVDTQRTHRASGRKHATALCQLCQATGVLKNLYSRQYHMHGNPPD